MMRKFIADNGGILAVLAVCFVIGAAYLEWRIQVNATAAINNAGSVTPAQLEAALKDIARNGEDIDSLEKVDERFESKIDRIVDILLEE